MFKEQIKVYIDSDFEVQYVDVDCHGYLFFLGTMRRSDGYGKDFYVFKEDTTIEEMARIIKKDKDIVEGIKAHEEGIVAGINKIVIGEQK